MSNAKIVGETLAGAVIVIVGIVWWYNTTNYNEAFEKRFVSACTASAGGFESKCACVYANLKREYTFDQAKNFDANPNSAETRSAMQGLINECI
jgi:hypothetical protein